MLTDWVEYHNFQAAVLLTSVHAGLAECAPAIPTLPSGIHIEYLETACVSGLLAH